MELFDEENAYTALAEQWENFGTLDGIEDERRKALPTPRWSVVNCFIRYSR